MKPIRIKPGDTVECPNCLEAVGECVIEPIRGLPLTKVVELCFRLPSTPECPKCGTVFYKPTVGFFTLKYGWTW